jgi:hypothetical protein
VNENEGNRIHNFTSSSGSRTVNYGSGSDFLTNYGSGYGSVSASASQKITVPTVPVSQHSIQAAFMTLLGDPNDLVQDAASKGIGIVYDSCSEADREKMVTSLLETITGGRKEVNKVRGRTLD